MEVRLLDAPVLDRAFAVERCRQTVGKRALDLRLDLLRVDRMAGSVAATMRWIFSSPASFTDTSAQAAT